MFRPWKRYIDWGPRPGPARRTRLNVQQLEDRQNPSTAFLATDLVSDLPGVAAVTDPTLQNAFGISLSPTGGAFWVSSNGAGLSELYGGDVTTNGVASAISQPFKVTIPGGTPTGQVFNGTTDFAVTDGTNTKPAAFIFASESGAITGWNPNVGVAAGARPPSLTAEVGFQATDGAIYKGLALAQVGGKNFLFATDFHNSKIDVLDAHFQKVTLGTNGFESFTDPNLPNGFAPFGIAVIDGKLYVSYAKQDADAEDDVAGKGNGFIDVFETNGRFDGRLASRGDLNSPYGMVQAPAGFGDFGGALLVGNFGDGRVHAFDPKSGQELGTLSESPGHPVVIDGQWGLAFGNGKTAGDATSLYYAAGPDHEAHGLFGRITANPAGTNPVSVNLAGSDLTITGSRDSDHVEVELARGGQQVVVEAGGQRIGTFDTAAVGTIHFNGFAGDDVFVVDPRITATVIADGGAGDDVLIGGGGDNILLGNAGNDVLLGGPARDILIGGDGRDLLVGGGNDDILIGGTTAYDANQAQLLQILTAWTSPAESYDDRVTTIRTGAGGVPKLDATTVTDDGVRDDLVGGPGLDWYIGELPDALHGRKPNEQIN
jgi:uncharacterized protein (TIGR03118 family)